MRHKHNDGLKKRCPRNPATGKRCARKDWPKCPHPWHFSFHHNGTEHRVSLDVIAKQRGEQPPRTKADAGAWRDRLRNEIRAGGRPDVPIPEPTVPDVSIPEPTVGLTVGEVMDRYVVASEVTRLRSLRQVQAALRVLRACEVPAAGRRTVRFETLPIADLTKADIEAIRLVRRATGLVGCNRLLARLRHLCNWAVGEGLTASTPFKRAGVSVVRLETGAEAPRTRRLEPGEGEALLACAAPHLRSLIVAALYTGCRVGELLSLQWHQIRLDEQGLPRWIELPAAKTKTGKTRTLPVGPRLRAELAMRRHAPDGQPHSSSAYVFGTETGEQIGSIKRAWEIAVLRSHGHAPVWVQGKRGRLSPESRDRLRAINLHFHDLRREFACTLLESSADLHDVRDFLGHANVTTTSRYLSSSPVRLATALARLDPEAPIRTRFAHAADPTDQPAEGLSRKSVN